MARALINKPKVILADEPTGSLDHDTSAEIGRMLLDISLSQGATLIAVTHNRDYARLFSQQLEMQTGGNLSAIKID